MATILIVDDEPIFRQLFQTVLEHDGHAILTAGNGRDALEVMRQQVPDLILLDISMPTMDGLSFLRVIRRHLDWVNVPVIIMSGLSDKQSICNAGSLGVRDYLLKGGFSMRTLRARIGKHLEPRPVDESARTPMLVE